MPDPCPAQDPCTPVVHVPRPARRIERDCRRLAKPCSLHKRMDEARSTPERSAAHPSLSNMGVGRGRDRSPSAHADAACDRRWARQGAWFKREGAGRRGGGVGPLSPQGS
eukprot:scaffold239766_cov26-Tisochrysis_lutea.AAC.1